MKSQPVSDIPSALRAIQARDYLSSAKYTAQQQIARTEGAHPHIIEFSRLLIERMAKRFYVPLYAHTMRRTMQEQFDLLARKVTRDSPADGLWPHQWHAVDIVHGILHWQMEKKSWAAIGHVGKELAKDRGFDIVWGGDWKFYDPAHWEIRDWKNQGPENFPVVRMDTRLLKRHASENARDYLDGRERELHGKKGTGETEE